MQSTGPAPHYMERPTALHMYCGPTVQLSGQLAAHRLPLHDLAPFCFLPKYCNFAGHLTQDILAKLKDTDF